MEPGGERGEGCFFAVLLFGALLCLRPVQGGGGVVALTVCPGLGCSVARSPTRGDTQAALLPIRPLTCQRKKQFETHVA